MANLNKLFPALAASLGLESRKSFMDGKFAAYGRREGFPVLVRLADTGKQGTVTVEARFRSGRALPKQLSFDPPLDGALRTGKIGVVFPRTGGTAQLTLPGYADWAKCGEDAQAVDSFLRGLARAGLSAGDTCHYCTLNRPARPMFNGRAVGQMCEYCEGEQRRAMAEERRFDPASLARLIPAGAAAVVLVAVCWALVWIGVDALFRWGHGTLQLPVKLSTLVAGCLGAAAALPLRLLGGIRPGATGWPGCSGWPARWRAASWASCWSTPSGSGRPGRAFPRSARRRAWPSVGPPAATACSCSCAALA